MTTKINKEVAPIRDIIKETVTAKAVEPPISQLITFDTGREG